MQEQGEAKGEDCAFVLGVKWVCVFFKLKVTKELVQELGMEMHQGTLEGSHGRVMKFFTKCP